MTQGRRRAGLLGEASSAGRIADCSYRENFDGYGPVEVGVERAIDHAHPSRAKLGLNPVMLESLADHSLNLQSERLSYHSQRRPSDTVMLRIDAAYRFGGVR